MKPLTLQATFHMNYTCVSNRFLDIYMPKASGEFVKIYLYILRCLTGSSFTDNCTAYRNGCSSYEGSAECFCVSFLADKFNLTENDILRALKYWEKEGLLILSYSPDSNGKPELCSVTVVSDIPSDNSLSETAAAETSISTEHADTIHISDMPSSDTQKKNYSRPRYTAAQLKAFAVDEELGQLLYIAQKYIGKTLSSMETNSIIFFYETLKLPSDLIEYLLEYCISKGHKDLRYMEKVALAWTEQGVTNVAQAQALTSSRNSDVYAVMKAFGITGRAVAPVERDYINKWSDSYCFDCDVIIEACNRTIQATHKPSFEYADTILTNWKKKGIKNLNDIQALDEEFDKSRKASRRKADKTTSSQPSNTASSNRFNNFVQREYDYEQMERTIVGKQLV